MKKIVYILMFLLISCGSENTPDTREKKSSDIITLSDAQVSNGNITSGKPVFGSVPHIINCNGIIDVPPDHKISLFAPMPGFLKTIRVLPGQEVKKGEVLFTLSHPDYINLQKQYIEAKNQLQYLEKEYERQKTLSGENATARKNFEKTESEYFTAKGQVAALEAQLRLLQLSPQKVWEGNISETITITSPIQGYISMFKANSGQFMAQDQEILSVINREHLHIELQVFEKDIPLVKKGQKITFTVSGTDKEYGAYVKLIGEEVDPVTRTVNVHGHIENDHPELKTGMYVNAGIYSEADSTYTLPDDALIKEGDNTFGFIAENKNTFKRVRVEVIHEKDGISSVSLPEGTEQMTWVLKGAYYLNAEMKKEEE